MRSQARDDGRHPLSDRLRDLRELRDVQQQQVARALGVSKSVVSGWENLRADVDKPPKLARLRQIVAESEASLNDAARTTELGAAFHLAVAEASHNRVLVVQLISLQHVSWPQRNPTLTPKVARRILDVHKELLALIEIRDAAAARRMMDDHVKMIRARRVSEHARSKLKTIDCC